MNKVQNLIASLMVVSIFITGNALAACTGASPTWTSTPDRVSVASCVNEASSGDTIHVLSGSAIWDSQLVIMKGINLIGPGISELSISAGFDAASPNNSNDEGNYLVVYKPTAALNEAFRLSGFTFDMNSKTSGLMLTNQTTTKINKIRIDNNAFNNATRTDGSMRAITVSGTVYGVIDNNTFSGNKKCIDSGGINIQSWSDLIFSFGSEDNIYYEDNTFVLGAGLTAHSAGMGGRYAARYNTYIHSSTTSLSSWFEAHGNQLTGTQGTMGVEIYGNKITAGGGVIIMKHRGGMGAIFNNDVVTSSSLSNSQVWEEFADTYNPPAAATNGQPQHVSDSYYWGNRKNSTILNIFVVTMDYYNRTTSTLNEPPVVVENREFWQQRAAEFDGASGVGCGPHANRPVTCTPGVGYWETNQSCSDLTGMVGANPSTPISGTLYKCTSTDTWEPYYKPYTYPHPLRGTITISGGISISGGSIQ
jgi:hypothetical protein